MWMWVWVFLAVWSLQTRNENTRMSHIRRPIKSKNVNKYRRSAHWVADGVCAFVSRIVRLTLCTRTVSKKSNGTRDREKRNEGDNENDTIFRLIHLPFCLHEFKVHWTCRRKRIPNKRNTHRSLNGTLKWINNLPNLHHHWHLLPLLIGGRSSTFLSSASSVKWWMHECKSLIQVDRIKLNKINNCVCESFWNWYESEFKEIVRHARYHWSQAKTFTHFIFSSQWSPCGHFTFYALIEWT